MIIRHCLPRAACSRLVGNRTARQWRRCLATEVESLEGSVENSSLETRSIDSAANDLFPGPVQPFVSGYDSSANNAVADAFLALQHIKKTSAKYGTSISPHYQPHTLLTHPPSPSDVTLELLLASQAHLGHSTSLWHPANSRYIFGIRQGIHIISLDATAAHLRRAAKVVSGVTERGGLVLFVGTRAGQDRAVVKAAQLASGCHLFDRWTPGTITNAQQILGRCRTKVVDAHDKELTGLAPQLLDRAALKPDLVVCLNPIENYVLLHECGQHNIPTIGIVDTDCNPSWVTYPIPANDDSLRCVQVIAGVLGRAGEEGQARRKKAARKGLVTYTPATGLTPPNEAVAVEPEDAAVVEIEANARMRTEMEQSDVAVETAAENAANERGDSDVDSARMAKATDQKLLEGVSDVRVA